MFLKIFVLGSALILLTTVTNTSLAQSVNSEKIDNRLLESDHKNFTKAEELTSFLILPFTTQEEKLIVIYRWIRRNIKYDYELAANDAGFTINVNFENRRNLIITRKSGICFDFALLFQFMSSTAGIESKEVHGHARDFTVDMRDSLEDLHAWNAVKLKGKWYLLDPTWGQTFDCTESNSLNMLSSPDKFIFSHWPFKREDAFLDKVPSLIEFYSMPVIFWENVCGFDFKNFPSGKVGTNGTLEVELPFPAELTTSLDIEKVKSDSAIFPKWHLKPNTKNTIIIEIHDDGEYFVQVGYLKPVKDGAFFKPVFGTFVTNKRNK